MVETPVEVSILGTTYTLEVKRFEDEEYFAKEKADGFCDAYTKRIVVCDMNTHPNTQNETPETCASMLKEIARHEIVHAFLHESGLDCSSAKYKGAWATNEEMVDWIAMQSPKMMSVFRQLGID